MLYDICAKIKIFFGKWGGGRCHGRCVDCVSDVWCDDVWWWWWWWWCTCNLMVVPHQVTVLWNVLKYNRKMRFLVLLYAAWKILPTVWTVVLHVALVCGMCVVVLWIHGWCVLWIHGWCMLSCGWCVLLYCEYMDDVRQRWLLRPSQVHYRRRLSAAARAQLKRFVHTTHAHYTHHTCTHPHMSIHPQTHARTQ